MYSYISNYNYLIIFYYLHILLSLTYYNYQHLDPFSFISSYQVSQLFKNFYEFFARHMRQYLHGLRRYFALSSNFLPVQSRACSATCLYISAWKKDSFGLRWCLHVAARIRNASLAISATPLILRTRRCALLSLVRFPSFSTLPVGNPSSMVILRRTLITSL